MTSRREFFQLATRTAIAAMLASNHGAATEQNDTQRATPRRGLPLPDLQQRFVDLRFGMFVHFNMPLFRTANGAIRHRPRISFVQPLSIRTNGPRRRSRRT